MEVKANITAEQLVGNIRFHGETNSDSSTVERIKQIKEVLEEVFQEINNTARITEGRHEGGAKEINHEIKELKKLIGLYLLDYNDFDVAMHVIEFNISEYGNDIKEWTRFVEGI